jgi:probable F420-dependent oxidoreductase
MRLGVMVRNMGPQSAPDVVVTAAQAADANPAIADLWVADHIAIPPDDAEGSGGRYLDPLATLAFLGGKTARIGLGTAVLVLPYRPPLPTAKWIATIQELSGNRFQLGVGVGWMQAEFRAVGVDPARRGRVTDETLAFLDRCFAGDVVEANGQPFLFLPCPPRPPVFIGGAPPAAFRRVFAHRAGWMPVGLTPEALVAPATRLREQADGRGVGLPEIAVLTTLPLDDQQRARDMVGRYAQAGATRVIHASRYPDLSAFRHQLDSLARITSP